MDLNGAKTIKYEEVWWGFKTTMTKIPRDVFWTTALQTQFPQANAFCSPLFYKQECWFSNSHNFNYQLRVFHVS